jgi:pimeloyl-ACP methyl ester carboxylesterase
VIGIPVLLAACVVGGVPAQCGTVTVPENRAEPAGATVALRVTVLPATVKAARRGDPLFYITGGPGGVAFDEVGGIATAFAAINRRRDIVFVDQRGVGGSNPLRCKLAALTGTVADLVAACLGQVGADVTMYRTPQAMDDLDAVRTALGYGPIDVFGVSYGATAAQVFLKRHPESVRTVILDGVTLLDIPVFERWSSNAQRALDLLRKRCSEDRGCKRAFPRWYERFPALLARLARKPVEVGKVTVDAASTAGTVDELTASAEGAARVPYTLAKAEAGSYRALAREIALYDTSTAESPVMPWAIKCTEPWAARDPARVAANARGTYMSYTDPASAVLSAQVCGAWPKVDPSGEDWTRPRSAVPALVLQGGADPKDPPANAAGIVQAMPNAGVVLAPGQGHGIAALGCLPVLIDRFLQRGSAAGLDTSCARLTPLPSFRLD